MMNPFAFLAERGTAGASILASTLTVATILVLAAILYAGLRLVVLRLVTTIVSRMQMRWVDVLLRRGVFGRLAAAAPGILVHSLAGLWMGEDSSMAIMGKAVELTAYLWMLLFGMLTIHSLLDALLEIYETLPFAKQLPIQSFVQVIKLVTVLVFLVISVSMLLGKSPALLISGMGAMTAVLMLVFKDPIMGFVAGIQLSANQMLAVGDWLEMPKYNADGDVIEVSLTTVKVRNWDKTITTIPTYSLVTDSFKNWRGMQEVGGRRIKRSLFIDMTSVKFLTEEDIERLRNTQLLSSYISEKIADIECYNREHGIDPASPVNGRRLTNIGTFRAYLTAYLKSHPGIHKNLIMMVRQLQPTSEGLPLEIYAFTSDTGWIAHEGVQADIFDHILAVVPEFGLRIFQTPSGSDVRAMIL
jgi:miniconductance mechanosensitive channel